jgi:hypothetical protein
MNGRYTTHASAYVHRFASGERDFLGFGENPMMRHDSQRLRARACIYVRVCLLAIIFAVPLVVPSAVAQTTTPQYLFLSTSVPNGQGAFVAGIVTYTVDTTTGALTQITPRPCRRAARREP